jgi:hypothetical protein
MYTRLWETTAGIISGWIIDTRSGDIIYGAILADWSVRIISRPYPLQCLHAISIDIPKWKTYLFIWYSSIVNLLPRSIFACVATTSVTMLAGQCNTCKCSIHSHLSYIDIPDYPYALLFSSLVAASRQRSISTDMQLTSHIMSIPDLQVDINLPNRHSHILQCMANIFRKYFSVSPRR